MDTFRLLFSYQLSMCDVKSCLATKAARIFAAACACAWSYRLFELLTSQYVSLCVWVTSYHLSTIKLIQLVRRHNMFHHTAYCLCYIYPGHSVHLFWRKHKACVNNLSWHKLDSSSIPLASEILSEI